MEYQSPVLRPESITLPPLSNGDTITVKKRLNQGEKRASQARLYSREAADGSIGVNPLQVGLSRICAYLLDWTIKGLDGKVIDIRNKPVEQLESVLDMLDPFIYDEIDVAIRAHEQAIIAARVKEKNDRDGEKKEPATSPSPSDAAGPSSTSEGSTPTTTSSSSSC